MQLYSHRADLFKVHNLHKCVSARERERARSKPSLKKRVIKKKEMKSAPYPLISLIQEVNWLYLGGGKQMSYHLSLQ